MELKEIQQQVAQVFLGHLEKDKIALDDDYLVLKIGGGGRRIDAGLFGL